MSQHTEQEPRMEAVTVEIKPRTVTVEEAAAELGIGRSLAYELARTGKLPALRLGHRLLIPRERLDAMLAAEHDAA
jgi:excisionase family DNA binding protein